MQSYRSWAVNTQQCGQHKRGKVYEDSTSKVERFSIKPATTAHNETIGIGFIALQKLDLGYSSKKSNQQAKSFRFGIAEISAVTNYCGIPAIATPHWPRN